MGQTEPGHAFVDGFHGAFGQALAIRVFNPQMKFAAVMLCKQPVKEGRTGTADM